MNRTLVSFSLFGNDSRYIDGAIRNAQHLRTDHPDWDVRFYTSDEVSAEVDNRLRSFDAKVVKRIRRHPFDGTFWRFEPMNETNYDFVIFRDVDSLIGPTDAACVSKWASAKRVFHLIRSHPSHWHPIMAGLWGCRPTFTPNFRTLLRLWRLQCIRTKRRPFHQRDDDQHFLARFIYPFAQYSCMVHSDFIAFGDEGPTPVPKGLDDVGFPGERLHADGTAFARDKHRFSQGPQIGLKTFAVPSAESRPLRFLTSLYASVWYSSVPRGYFNGQDSRLVPLT